MVVLAGLFWDQSMNTLPSRWCLAITARRCLGEGVGAAVQRSQPGKQLVMPGMAETRPDIADVAQFAGDRVMGAERPSSASSSVRISARRFWISRSSLRGHASRDPRRGSSRIRHRRQRTAPIPRPRMYTLTRNGTASVPEWPCGKRETESGSYRVAVARQLGGLGQHLGRRRNRRECQARRAGHDRLRRGAAHPGRRPGSSPR
jgi:hypothetical protein